MTEHPLLADLQRRFNAILETKPTKPDIVIERESKTGHGDRGIPVYDGNRGMPGGCTINGTRPGDSTHQLELDEQFLHSKPAKDNGIHTAWLAEQARLKRQRARRT